MGTLEERDTSEPVLRREDNITTEFVVPECW
jgi:hypothetical protein